MLGFVYLFVALGGWTVWAVLSAKMGSRACPLNTLLWTGLVSAFITVGGFVVHFRQLRMPSTNDWWLMGVFCAANAVACFGYFAALRHLPGSLVLPLSHLYLIVGPLLLAFWERRPLNWQQFLALCITTGGVVMFLSVSSHSKQQDPKTESAIQPHERLLRPVNPALSLLNPRPRSAADILRSGPLRARRYTT